MRWRFLIIPFVVIAANWSGEYALIRHFSSTPAEPPQLDLGGFPTQLGSWVGSESPLDPALFQATSAAALLNRVYGNPQGQSIALQIGIWTDYGFSVPHRPELCYTSAGWTLISTTDITLEGPEGQAVPSRLLTFERRGARGKVLYWCQLGDRFALDSSDIRAAKVSHRGRSLPLAFKVTLATSVSMADRGEAEHQLRNLASLVLPKTDEIYLQMAGAIR